VDAGGNRAPEVGGSRIEVIRQLLPYMDMDAGGNRAPEVGGSRIEVIRLNGGLIYRRCRSASHIAIDPAISSQTFPVRMN
jgi:hypothetical protein